MKRKLVIIIFIIIFIAIFIGIYLYKHNSSQFKITQIKIKQTDDNYAKVSNVEELEKALLNDKIQIIDINNDIDLGYNVIKEKINSTKIFQNHNLPLTHPKLKETGVSKLKISNKNGLIIYSNNGSKILHCNIRIKNGKNIKIDNISFDELWEWDEETQAEYDRNDWDYITIENSEAISISHCEFSKSYDGITDIKNSKNITIEYCKVNEININNEFYNQQFEYLEKNIDNYPMYSFLRDEMQLSYDEVKELCAHQFKVYTIGTEQNENEECTNIVIHDSLYLNTKTRIPMIRNGTAYVYNVYADSTRINNVMEKLIVENKFEKIKEKYSKIASLNPYGIIAKSKSFVLAKNTVYKGAKYQYSADEENFCQIKIKNSDKIIKNLKNNLEKIVGIKKDK